MQARATVWCRDLADTRVHGTTRPVPRLVFETQEQRAQAQRLGPAVGQFITVLLRGTFLWARLRQAQKLLRAERYGPDRINAACAQGARLRAAGRRARRSDRPHRPDAPARGWRGRARRAAARRFTRAPESFIHPSIPRSILMMLDLTRDPVRRLKRLRLGGLLPTLPDRVTHARQGKLGHGEFLALLLQDEIDRRDNHGLTLRLEQAAFDETATFEQIVWDSPGQLRSRPDRARVLELFSLHWLA
jgi:hypothetical protein